MMNSQIGGDLSLKDAGDVDLKGAFVKGTADLRGTVLSKGRVAGARFGQVFFDATTKFLNDEENGPYVGKIETAQDERGFYFVFS